MKSILNPVLFKKLANVRQDPGCEISAFWRLDLQMAEE